MFKTLMIAITCILGFSYVLGGLKQRAVDFQTGIFINCYKGPYDIKIYKFEDCEDEGTGQSRFTSRISSVGHGKYVYNSPIYLGIPIDDKYKFQAEVQQWGNGGYRPRFATYTAKNCEELWKNLKDMMISVFSTAARPVESCPIPAGNYTPYWEMYNLTVAGFPVMPYNKYKVIAQIYYDEKKAGCFMIYIELVPKGSAK